MLASGPIGEDHDDDGEEDDDGEDDGDSDDPPISWQCLPISVVMALYKAYNCKHMIDLAPSPLKLAYKVVASGGTYVGLCATTFMANHLEAQLHDDLMKGIVDKTEKHLYDPRFSTESPGKADNETKTHTDC